MNDYQIFSMSSNRKNVNSLIFKKNVRFQHFCQKMRVMEKWCVTKVAHCMYFEYLLLLVISRFGFEGWIRIPIASDHDLCILFTNCVSS